MHYAGSHRAAIRRRAASFWKKAYEDNLTGLSAMVAYNLLLSIFPFALLLLFVGGQILRSPGALSHAQQDLVRLFPDTAESTLRNVLNGIKNRSTHIGIIALIATVYTGASFWGAMDTAFCRIYRTRCRGWVEQKRFALLMLLVSISFLLAAIVIPAAESLLVRGTRDLPFGLNEIGGLTTGLSIGIGVTLLFVVMCAIYLAVPNQRMPWAAVWPGACGASLAIGLLNAAFPIYLSEVSAASSLGGAVGFIVIVLVWFYVLALMMLGGAAVNALRFKALDRSIEQQ